MKPKYAIITFTITASEVDGLSNNWNKHERRIDLQIPIETVKSIDFNVIRNELMKASIESFEAVVDKAA